MSDYQIGRFSQKINNTIETTAVDDNKTPVQHENIDKPSPTPDDQSEMVLDKPNDLQDPGNP